MVTIPAMATLAQRWQARAVDAIKRRALRLLHVTAAGEALILASYLWAEEAAELGPLNELTGLHPEPWLQAQLARHLGDEARHASILRTRLRALGREPSGTPQVDVVSAHKLRSLKRLIESAAGHFAAKGLVPLFAVVESVEATTVRVFKRHLEVLARPDAPEGSAITRAILIDLLADEQRHQQACAAALVRLVQPQEEPHLAALRARIDEIGRSFGVIGAAALWLAGAGFQLQARLSGRPNRKPGGAHA